MSSDELERLSELQNAVRNRRIKCNYKYNGKGTLSLSTEECIEELKKLDSYENNVGN